MIVDAQEKTPRKEPIYPHKLRYLYSYFCIECEEEWSIYEGDEDDETCPNCYGTNLARYN